MYATIPGIMSILWTTNYFGVKTLRPILELGDAPFQSLFNSQLVAELYNGAFGILMRQGNLCRLRHYRCREVATDRTAEIGINGRQKERKKIKKTYTERYKK